MLIPLQEGSRRIAEDKHTHGQPVEAMKDRLALTLAAQEAQPGDWQEPFRWALDYAFPGGRIMANAGVAGRSGASTINCTVSRTIEDSMAGIMAAVTDAALTLKSGAGIGYDFSTLRPAGAWVSGAGASTSGPLPFMDVFDAMCKTVSSAGGRRGAQMGCLDIGHPDIEAFITAKRQPGRLRAFNVSCLLDDAFLDALRQDGDWPLVFPAFAHELQEPTQEIVWRRWPAAEAQHRINERGEVACRVYRRVPARTLWDLIMRSTYAFSDPGFVMIDEINRMNPLWFCEEIRATNPCVTADTWVHTTEGPRQVRQLIGKAFTALVDGQTHPSGREGFFKTATRPVVRLHTAAGYNLRLTADHRVRRVIRFTRYRTETEWCAAGDLQVGDRVLLNDQRCAPAWQGELTQEQGYLLGLLVGDGTLKNDKAILSVWGATAVANGPEAELPAGIIAVMQEALRAARTLAHRADFSGWQEVGGRNEYRLSLGALKALAGAMGMSPGNKAVTPALEQASSEGYQGFLRGFFDADGSVQGTQAKGVSVRLAQSDLARLEAVQRMLLRLGIVSTIYRDRRSAPQASLPDGKGGRADYAIRPQHELVISGENLKRFQEQVGFTDSDKSTRLESLLAGYRRELNRERFVARVTGLTAAGTEDVFDVRIPGINTFDANGLHAHNCGEQPLPPHGACLLGSVNLAALVEAPFTPQARFDEARFAKVVRIFSRMLDNVVDIDNLPLSEQRAEIRRKRRHGTGILGLGSALTMLGIRYGSTESVAFTESVCRRLAVESWQTGLELAREKGPAPVLTERFEVTPAMLQDRPEMARDGISAGDRLPGRVLHAHYSRYLQRLAGVAPELVTALAESGARYSHATSIAPTGTMAAGVGNNASNGIEPTFSHEYTRNMVVPGRKAREALRMCSYELLAYREAVDPEADAEALPPAFASAHSVPPEGHVAVMAAAQRWIDSAVSKTINVPTALPFEDFKALYLTMIDQGLKGGTTFRYNPEAQQGVLVTDSDLAATVYEFTLADGSAVRVRGNETVEYEGERYLAANLYQALKEGDYGRA